MKKLFHNTLLIFTLAALCFCTGLLSPQEEERYFDTAGLTSKALRLTILYPSKGSIEALLELRKQNIIPSENLLVIGVYHEKERTDYQKSKEFVKENHLDWVRFHKLSGEISRETLFWINPLTQEFRTIFQKSDGIIFFGGADIPPFIYNEKTNLLTHVTTPFRHFLETSFIFHLLGGTQDNDFEAFLESETDFPILGICLGCQSLNVGTGGTLIQDIWSEKYEKKYFEDIASIASENWHTNPLAQLYPEEKLLSYAMHPIRFQERSKFISEFGFKKEDTPTILSAHHQAVGNLGKGIKPAATSLDGKVIESIEHEKYTNVLGVQFHPEFPVLWDATKKFKISPTDKEEIALRSILENNLPSLAFHKKIWAWFFEKLAQNHRN